MTYEKRILPSQRMKWCFPIILLVSICAPFALFGQVQDDSGIDEDIYELSPFVVDASGDTGYYTANTLAGSRLNTKISDLASSITVINLEQMDDTASVDINDVFRYEANTEGADTYTESVLSLRSDGIVDTNAGFTHGANGTTQGHNTANRIRGIGRPSTTQNYYPSLDGVPFDSYNISSVEIARGPNSLLFGMGNPAGIVNQSTAAATLGRDFAKLKFRTDDRGSFRASVSVNKELIEDKLALYAAFVTDHRKFEREPSHDDTERAYVAVTYKPLKHTTIRANFERYDNDHRRPNTLTPREAVSDWRNGGMWGYNPATAMFQNAAGEVKGPIATRNTSPLIEQTRAWIASQPGYDASLWSADQLQYNGVAIYGSAALTDKDSILFIPGMEWSNRSNRPKFRILDGQVMDYVLFEGPRYRVGYGTPENPAANADYVITEDEIWADPVATLAYNTQWSVSRMQWAEDNGVGNWKYPGIHDKSIYDWEKVNTLAMNFGEAENTTVNFEFEQQLLSDLTLSLGFFQQDFEEMTSYTVSQLNAATIYVDTNTHMPDGSVNPMFGLPMIVGPSDPDRFETETLNKTYRAMLAYTPDFTGNDNWTRWFGRHQAIGLVSKYHVNTDFYRKRYYIEDSDEGVNNTVLFTKNPNNNADGTPTGYNLENRSVQRLWYLASPGDAQDGTVTHAASPWDHGSYEGNLPYFNYDSNTWEEQRYYTSFLTHSAHTARSERDVESMSFGLTSFLWEDRLVTTLGWRKDKYKARATSNAVLYEDELDANGELVEKAPAMTNQEKWVDGYYQTDALFQRWDRWDKVTGETTTMGAVLRPFDNWDGIKSEFLRSLGFSYNESDNFNPPPDAQTDAFGQRLGKPVGNGKDWGIQFSLMDNKLFARVNWFEATNENERQDPGSTLSRLNGNVDTTLFRNWARTIVLINMGYDPRDSESWNLTNNFTDAENQALEGPISEIWGQDYHYYDNVKNISGTRNAEAEGMEVQIVYNPIPNWTMKFTGGKQETVYSDVLKEYFAWYEHRKPVWDAAQAANYLNDTSFLTYTTEDGKEVDLTNFWTSYGYRDEILVDHPLTPNVQRYFDETVTPQVIAQTDLEGQVAPGQRKYRWSFLSNYTFVDSALEGVSVGGGVRWEDKAIIGYYGRPNPETDSTDLTLADVSRPIYDDAHSYVDLWAGYSFKAPFFNNVDAKLKLNIVNAFEDGELRPVAVNYDGTVSSYRIIDPRQFILTLELDF